MIKVTKQVFIYLIFLQLSNNAFAQKEGSIWYFGENAGLDFNKDIVSVLTNGAMNTGEGCSAISDEQGNLLFYTDGITVWNKNHLPMPNGSGLMGHSSATQSALIVPKPGSNSTYYIFTVDYLANPNGFRYSVVDMTLEGGMGDVTTKNILLHSPVTEKLTAVEHSSECAFWIIIHEHNTDGFRAYLLDSSGINNTPVISNTGSVHTASFMNQNSLGQLKASLKGDKIALAISDLNLFELFDFDNATGIVFNPISLPAPSSTYGVEFSPDGTRLYGSLIFASELYQYDLTAGSVSDIINSAKLIASSAADRLGALQLGLDGKIYCALNNMAYLGAVNNPDSLGTACNYIDSAVYLSGKLSKLGLPNFMHAYYYPQFKFTSDKNCIGDSLFFSITNIGNADSVYWNFGDSTSGVWNTSDDLNPFHIYDAPGTYNVQLIKWGKCNTVYSRFVTILPLPEFNLGNDTSLCPGTSLTLNAGTSGSTYLWQDGSVDSHISVSSPGLYWVEVNNICGSGADSIDIKIENRPIVNLGNDTTLCTGQSLVLDAAAPGEVSYKWQDGSIDSYITVSSPGIYWIEIANNCGSNIDSIYIEQVSLKAGFDYKAIPCTNQIQFINLSSDTLNSSWDFGDGTTSDENNPLHTYQDNKPYLVTLITSPASPCPDTAFAVIPFENDAIQDTLFIPNVFTPNGDGKNDFFEIKGFDNPCIDISRLIIFNRWGKKVFEAVGSAFSWDGTTNGKRLTEGIYFYVLEGEDVNRSGSVMLLR